MLVIFLQIDKESKSKKSFYFILFIYLFFFFGGGGGVVVAGGGMMGVNIMYKCFKWHFYSSRNTNVPNCSEIHA